MRDIYGIFTHVVTYLSARVVYFHSRKVLGYDCEQDVQELLGYAISGLSSVLLLKHPLRRKKGRFPQCLGEFNRFGKFVTR